MPFRQIGSSNTGKPPKFAAVMTSLVGETKPVLVRDYSEVSLVSVKVADGEKEMYFGLAASGNAGSNPSSKTEGLRRKTEEAAIRTWSFKLTSSAMYEGCGEQMQISGGSLKRSLHDFMWMRSALVAEYPGVIVPPITAEAASGDSYVLERFVQRVIEHELLHEAAVFKCFVLAPPSEFVAAQRDFISDGAPPPLLVQANALFLRGKELAIQKIEEAEDDDAGEGAGAASGNLHNSGIPAAGFSTADVREAQKWTLEEQRKMEKMVQACAAAALADGKAITARCNADAIIAATRDLVLGDQPPDSIFGAASVLPLLRDMLGHLHALSEAIAGREGVRRSLVAARDNHLRHVESLAKRGDRLKSAERHSNSAKQLETQQPTEAAKKAKNTLSAIGLKAASGIQKTAANFASQQADVDKASEVVARLKDKFKQVNERLQAEVSRLQTDWPLKIEQICSSYLDAERKRSEHAAETLLALENATPVADATNDRSQDDYEEQEDNENNEKLDDVDMRTV